MEGRPYEVGQQASLGGAGWKLGCTSPSRPNALSTMFCQAL